MFSAELKVGFFVIIMIAILVWGTLRVGNMEWGAKDGTRIGVFFKSVAGLELKAVVCLAGVRVGRVEKIQIQEGKVLLTLYIEPGITIPSDSEIGIGSLGLMGEKYIEITPVDPNSPPLTSSSPPLVGKEGADIGTLAQSGSDLVQKLSSIADDIKAVTTSLRGVLGTSEGEFQMQNILDSIEGLTGGLDELIATNQANLTTTIANFRDFSNTLAQRAPAITDKIEELSKLLTELVEQNKVNVTEGFTQIRQASEKLNATLSSAQAIAEKIEKGEGTIGKLVTKDELHDNLNSALTNLDVTLTDARKMLTQFDQYKFYLGYRGEYMYDAGDTKNYISLQVQPRPNKYYLLELVDDPVGRIRKKETIIDIDSSTTGHETRRILTTDIDQDKLKITALIAMKYYGFWLKGGLIESEGGVGADLDLLPERWCLSLEGFDFANEENDPHLKVGTRYFIWKGFYINTGWDNFLNTNQDNYFIGGGLRFEDEDLKYILGKIPTGF